MTYTYKLARRLAILRDYAMLLAALVLFTACSGDSMGPESNAPSDSQPYPTFRVVPGAVTIEVNQPLRFRGESLVRRRGELVAVPLSWEASGGTIDEKGTFTAPSPGTYKVVGRGRGRQKPDTSTVVVVPPLPGVTAVQVSPHATTLSAGAAFAFTAVGRLSDSTTAPVGIMWSATGGTIDPSGLYTAGANAGSYRVIATNTAGSLADTAAVTISAVTPPPPSSPPAPTLTSVVLKPGTVSLASGATKQFVAFGRNSQGDSVAVSASFSATGGTITPGGLYTAGSTAGTFRVVASSSGLADTAVVTLTRIAGSGGARGIPYGVFSAWEGTTYKSNTDAFTLSIGAVSASNVLARIDMARSRGKRIILAMTGGSHEQYKTNGVFDMVKWRTAMQTYNTAAIKTAIAAAVADGTVIGNSVMDEPHNTGNNSWGPRGTLTKAMVDDMCGQVRAMFPTLPVGVVHPYDLFEPTKSYRVCDFLVSQYAHRKGDIRTFRDEALAMGRRDGHAIAFSMNILNGGVQAARDGNWNCSPTLTAGRGTFDPNCRMTPEQVRDWGILLGSAGCALTMWRYDADFMADPRNQQAFKDVASHLASLPAQSCRRS